jgi:hypothetical protein
MDAYTTLDFDFTMMQGPEFPDVFPCVPPGMMVQERSSYPYYSPAFDGEVMLTPPRTASDDQSSMSDGSESGSVHHAAGVFQQLTKDEMAQLSVCQADLEALSNAGDQPQHTHAKKMKKTSLANLSEEERAVRRRTKNREAAALSRQRKRSKLETLEKQVERQKKINGTLINERDVMKVETNRLRGEVEYLKSVLSKSLAVAHMYKPGADVPVSPFMLTVH